MVTEISYLKENELLMCNSKRTFIEEAYCISSYRTSSPIFIDASCHSGVDMDFWFVSPIMPVTHCKRQAVRLKDVVHLSVAAIRNCGV
ncbi:hypothetical protein CEXT_27731 [Caerostris extrusa]|uniref:Uncharacterized protein n=1 Tax=Caerostris extrusa TaxID=172846 RepID=A0AAV4YCK9_CAEEX|nr:hypothetical protein CEXT_27731 [Caerostris extrusa]